MSVVATIVGRNEASWLRESILSIEPFVDEIVFLDDKSDDSSLKIAKLLECELNKLTVFSVNDIPKLKDRTLGDYKNFLIENSTSNWVLRWDGDFIAYNSGKQNIQNLLNFAKTNANKYDGYVLSGPNLSGDLYHQDPNKLSFGPECYLFKRNFVKFENNRTYIDSLNYVNGLRLGYAGDLLGCEHYFLHMNTLKPIERLVYRVNMTKFQIESNSSSGYWEWLYNKYKLDKKIAIKQKLDKPVTLIDFDFNKWGQHPTILTNSPNVNKFKLKNTDNGVFLEYPKYCNEL